MALEYALINNDTEYAVIGYTFDGLEEVTIPSRYNGLLVTALDDDLFKNQTGLRKIIIPNSIKSVGVNVFDNCTNLEYNTKNGLDYLGNELNPYLLLARANVLNNVNQPIIEIANGTSLIASNTFENNPYIEEVILPTSVTLVGLHAFKNCTNLKTVRYEGNLDGWLKISFGNQFACPLCNQADLYFDTNSLVEEINTENVESNISTIRMYSFYRCRSLKKLTISNNISLINYLAFGNCDNITEINFSSRGPNNFLLLDRSAFAKGDNAFDSGADYVLWEKSSGNYYIGTGLYKCLLRTTSKNLTIPANCIGVTSAIQTNSYININVQEENTFFSSDGNALYSKDKTTLIRYASGRPLNTFIIPKDVEVIDEHAFQNATNLKAILLPGASKYEESVGLTNTTLLQENATTSNTYTLSGTWKINDSINTFMYDNGYGISLNNTVGFTSNGEVYYRIATNPRNFTGENFDTISYESLDGMTKNHVYSTSSQWINVNYQTITFNDVWEVDEETYNWFVSIAVKQENATIELKGITTIKDYAFLNAKNLEGMVIPDSVASMGKYIFKGCENLRFISLEAVTNLPELYKYTFTTNTDLKIKLYCNLKIKEKLDLIKLK